MIRYSTEWKKGIFCLQTVKLHGGGASLHACPNKPLLVLQGIDGFWPEYPGNLLYMSSAKSRESEGISIRDDAVKRDKGGCQLGRATN